MAKAAKEISETKPSERDNGGVATTSRPNGDSDLQALIAASRQAAAAAAHTVAEIRRTLVDSDERTARAKETLRKAGYPV